MSEIPGTLPDASELRFDENGTNSAAPSSGLGDDGYDTDEIPLSTNFNYLFERYWLAIKHLLERGPREFTTLREGILATAAGDTFRVRPMAHAVGYQPVRGSEIFAEAGEGTGTIVGICTDGSAIYYAQGAYPFGVETVVPGNLTIEPDARPQNVISMAVGHYLFVLSDDDAGGGNNELHVIDVGDGTDAFTYNIATVATTAQIATNGSFLCLSNGTNIEVYSIASNGALTSTGSITPATSNPRICIYDNKLFILDVDAGQLNRADLGTRSVEINISYANADDPRDIATDGKRVVLVSDDDTSLSVECFGVVEGDALWSRRLPSNTNALRVCVDQRFAYVSDSANKCHMLELDTGLLVATFGDFVAWAADGVSVIGVQPSDGDLKRLYTGRPAMQFMRENGRNPYRRPFYTLAVPEAEAGS